MIKTEKSRRTPNTWPSARCLAISSSWVSWEKWRSSTTPSYTGMSSSNYLVSIFQLIIYQNSRIIIILTFLHRCCEQLLVGRKKQPLSDQAEDLECLCHLIRTCGKNLDSTVGKVHYLVQRFVSSIGNMKVLIFRYTYNDFHMFSLF